MLVVRNAQLAVLGAPYVDELVAFVRTNLPDYYARTGEAGARELVLAATAKAKAYGIERCKDVGKYIGFMDGLGWSFDTDPRYEWAGATLRDPGLNAEDKLALLLRGVASY
jgi:hypothetical protein